MDSLNEAQRRAATAADGPVAIIAGPGTGKTKTLTERIMFLIRQGVAPDRILALTFTNKAAAEIKTRVAIPAVYIATFHGLCFDIITDHDGKAPAFISEPARLALITSLPTPMALRGSTVRERSLVISRVKNMALDSPAAVSFTAAYDATLHSLGLMDFDDLLRRVHTLLADGEFGTTWKQAFDHILVDEFQDTNLLQYALLQRLRSNDTIYVIGDPQQSIYGFRGADGDIFTRFAQDFPHAQTITLGINYRSARGVVALANAIYPQAKPLEAYSGQPGNAKAIEVLNEYSEARWIINEIQKVIGGSDLQRAVSDDDRMSHRSLRDFAILYRGRAAARAVQAAIIESGLPYQVVGDGSPYDEPEVQTVIQLLARCADAKRDVSIPGLTSLQIHAICQTLDATARPYAVAEAIMTACGFEPSVALRQLLGTLMQFTTVSDAVAYFDDIAAGQFYDPRAEAVTLLTIHASKGLEFGHVFLIGCEDGILPSAKGDDAEERRLFYVAATRARDALYILHARQRGGKPARISPYIADIPADILPRVTDTALTDDQRKAVKRRARRAQTSLF